MPPLSAVSKINSKFLNEVRTLIFPKSASESSADAAQKTYAIRWPLPCDVSGLKIKFFSGTVSGTLKAFWAKSTVSDDTGASLTWKAITVNGSATITRSGSSNEIVSDLIAQNLVYGTDYLFIRVVGTNVSYWDSGLGDNCEALSNSVFGVGFAHRVMPGDLGNSGWAQPAQMGTLPTQIQDVFFYPKDKVAATIACVGDSLDEGWNTTGTAEFQFKAPIIFASQFARTDGLNLGFLVRAVGGQTHTVSVSEIENLSDVDFVTLRAWSPNGSFDTQAHFDAMMTETMYALGRIKRKGFIPVMLTSAPIGASGVREDLRNAQNERVRALASRYIVADIDVAVRDDANHSVLKAEYLDPLGNSTHLSLAGYQKCGEVIYNSIKLAL